jgi:peptidoglycan/xylan/chitin deacetylase (PgdA/CDA1 family)
MRLAATLVLLLTAAACAPPRSAPRAVPDHVVVLTFDDAVASHYTNVAPLLRKYGFGATFFVTEFVEPPFSDKSLYMTWEQIRALSRMGFEIGNHTAKHTHVDHMDRAAFDREMGYIEEKCDSLGIPRPVSFAYPAYVTTPQSPRWLRERGYRFARAGGDRAYDPLHDDPYLIPSFTTGADNRAAIYAAFEEARDGRIVVLTIHGVPDTAHPWVNTPLPLFEEYLRWLHDHHYRVIAMRDLARWVPEPRTETR